MIWCRLRESRHDHVGVADCLDLLYPVARRERIELRDDAAQQLDRLVGAKAQRERHEARDVGEHHGGFVDAVGDGDAGLGLEALHDGVGQDVAQDGIGFGLGVLSEAERVIDRGRDEDEGGYGALHVKRVLPPDVRLARARRWQETRTRRTDAA